MTQNNVQTSKQAVVSPNNTESLSERTPEDILTEVSKLIKELGDSLGVEVSSLEEE